MVTKKLISLAEHLKAMRLESGLGDSDTDLPPTNPCPNCRDLGVVQEILEEGILGVKQVRARLISCPYCEKGQARAREILSRRLERTRLPSQYAEADLNRWGDPTHPNRKGKVKAFMACRAMLSHEKHLVSSHTIANYLLKLYGKSSPQWVTASLEQANDVRNGLVLWGDYGTGKTWLAAATMSALAQMNQYVLYMRMSQLMQSLRDSWKSDESTGRLLQDYCEVPILFIDDMSDSSQDTLPLPSYQQDYAAVIMRSRMGDRLPTLVTSNWDPDRFALKWGRVCAEVMLEGLHWIKVGGERLRNVSSAREETL
jgi:DNA replication protein DnaC